MRVLIYDWEEDAAKDLAIKVMRMATSLNIAGARRLLDTLIEGQPVIVECFDNQSALDMIDQLHEVGFFAKRLPH